MRTRQVVTTTRWTRTPFLHLPLSQKYPGGILGHPLVKSNGSLRMGAGPLRVGLVKPIRPYRMD
jgi:hypothetical protein